MAKARRYKPEDRAFSSRHVHWDFSLTILPALGLTQLYNRNKQLGSKGGQCVGLKALPPSCAECLEILGTSTSISPKGLSGPAMGQLYLYIYLSFNDPNYTTCHVRIMSQLRNGKETARSFMYQLEVLTQARSTASSIIQ